MYKEGVEKLKKINEIERTRPPLYNENNTFKPKIDVKS
jgi:hypothetical protein